MILFLILTALIAPIAAIIVFSAYNAAEKHPSQRPSDNRE
jgi:hypothetical protein